MTRLMILLVMTTSVLAQTGNVYHRVTALDEYGEVSLATVEIYKPGTTTHATIYKDRSQTLAITQPITTSSTNTTLVGGTLDWYGPDGYDYKVTTSTLTASNSETESLNASHMFIQMQHSMSLDNELYALSRIDPNAGDVIYFPTASTGSSFPSTSWSRGLMGMSSEALFKAYVNLEIGTDVQAYDPNLATWAGIAPHASWQDILDGTTTTGANTSTVWSQLRMGTVVFTSSYANDWDATVTAANAVNNCVIVVDAACEYDATVQVDADVVVMFNPGAVISKAVGAGTVYVYLTSFSQIRAGDYQQIFATNVDIATPQHGTLYPAVAASACWFGADATGATDSGDALSAAIRNGSPLWIPGGTYLSSQVLTPKTSAIVYGAGIDMTTLKYTGASGVDAFINCKGRADTRLRDLTITTDANSNPETVVFWARNAASNSAGSHTWEQVKIGGYPTKALWYSVSSESNLAVRCKIELPLGATAPYGYVCCATDILAVDATVGTSGGNTIPIHFSDCTFVSYSQSASVEMIVFWNSYSSAAMTDCYVAANVDPAYPATSHITVRNDVGTTRFGPLDIVRGRLEGTSQYPIYFRASNPANPIAAVHVDKMVFACTASGGYFIYGGGNANEVACTFSNLSLGSGNKMYLRNTDSCHVKLFSGTLELNGIPVNSITDLLDTSLANVVYPAGDATNYTGHVVWKNLEAHYPYQVSISASGDANPASYTLTPTSNYVELYNNDTDGANVTMGETGMMTGTLLTIVNRGTNPVTILHSSGVCDLQGNTNRTMAQYDPALILRYTNANGWVESGGVYLTDDESTNDNHELVFTTTPIGNGQLETDGDIHYNPSTGLLTLPRLYVDGTGSYTYPNFKVDDDSARTIAISGDGMWRSDGDNDTTGISFNRVGYNNGTTRFRDVTFMDGKGANVMLVDGSEKNVYLYNDLKLASDSAVLTFGADHEISLTHLHNSGLQLTGKLGIGTSDPNTALDVEGTVTANALIVDHGATIGGFARSNTTDYRRFHEIGIQNIATGASGATYVIPDANRIGGWDMDTDTEYLYGDTCVHADWDGASNPVFQFHFAVNTDNTGGGSGDTVDLKLSLWYKAAGQDQCRVQTSEVATTVGQCSQYTLFKVSIPLDWDAASNVLVAGDIIGFRLNLETDTSEVDDITIEAGSFYYNTTHIGIESGDVNGS